MPLNRGFSARLSSQAWTATEGQTVFTLSNSKYIPGKNLIEVFIDGIHQDSDVSYEETSPTSFTLSEGLPAGTTVEAKWYENTLPSVGVGHSQTHKLGGQDEIKISDLAGYSGINERINSKADKYYVDNKLTGAISSSPKAVYNTLADLQTVLPLGAQGTYVVLADGKWYFWNGSVWTAGGVYQSTAIADNSITIEKTNFQYLKTILKNIAYYDPAQYLTQPINSTGTTNINANLTPYTTFEAGKYLLFVDFNINVTNLPTGRFIPYVFSGSANTLIDYDDAKSVAPVIAEIKDVNNVLSYGIVNVPSAGNYRIGLLLTQLTTSVTSIVTITADRIYAIKLDTIDDSVIEALKMYELSKSIPMVTLPDLEKAKKDITSIKSVVPVSSPIVCYGDSMTGTTTGWVNTLATNYGLNIINRGIGGQIASQISTRQGGLPLIANPFTIPADTSQVAVTMNTPLTAQQSSYEGINPVSINGVRGTLRNTSGTANGYTFARSQAGVSVNINRPTVVHTDNMITYKKNPMIIWVGTNGDYTSGSRTSANIIEIIEQMLSYGECQKYMIIGLTTDVNQGIPDLNTALAKRFGRRFLDLRSYLISYGLADMSITPTTDDNNRIAANNVPSSLLSDATHLTVACQQQVVAPLVYKKLQELYII